MVQTGERVNMERREKYVVKTEPRLAPPREGLDFPDAMRAITQGLRITREAWNNPDTFGFMSGGFLALHKAGEPLNVLHQWIVNDGDLLAEDWLIVEPRLN